MKHDSLWTGQSALPMSHKDPVEWPRGFAGAKEPRCALRCCAEMLCGDDGAHGAWAELPLSCCLPCLEPFSFVISEVTVILGVSYRTSPSYYCCRVSTSYWCGGCLWWNLRWDSLVAGTVPGAWGELSAMRMVSLCPYPLRSCGSGCLESRADLFSLGVEQGLE